MITVILWILSPWTWCERFDQLYYMIKKFFSWNVIQKSKEFSISISIFFVLISNCIHKHTYSANSKIKLKFILWIIIVVIQLKHVFSFKCGSKISLAVDTEGFQVTRDFLPLDGITGSYIKATYWASSLKATLGNF